MNIGLEAFTATELDKIFSRTDSRSRWFKPPDEAVSPKKKKIELDKSSSSSVRFFFVSSLSFKHNCITVLQKSPLCVKQLDIQR
jgi:hypothetical protein